jgi:hypothetical protein
MINRVMDYKKHYTLLIERATNRQLHDYKERHHILPKCMGGTDATDNLVYLTPEEHYLAHLLLVKIYPEETRLVFAAHMMSVGKSRNNKVYGWLKKKYISECRKRTGIKNPSYGKKWYHHPTTLENGKFLKPDIPIGWEIGRVPKNKKYKQKKNPCSKCGDFECSRPSICKNGQRIKRFIENFDFDTTVIGTNKFYQEYDKIVEKLEINYTVDNMSVEEMRIVYGLNNNETMRKILQSLGIDRRSLSDAVKNIHK